MGDGGKGSSPRPLSVDNETFSNNWDNIFRKDKPAAEDTPTTTLTESPSWVLGAEYEGNKDA